jgi:hypothetical protein
MLQEPRAGRQAFQVVIYNKDVRALVKDNQPHSHYADHWADGTVQAIEARDEGEARRLLAERYPPEAGFVVQSVRRRSV